MKHLRPLIAAVILLGAGSPPLGLAALAQTASAPAPQVVVELAAPTTGPVSGRLRLTAIPFEEMQRTNNVLRMNPDAFPDRYPPEVLPDTTSSGPVWLAAQEVLNLKSGESLAFQPGALVYPNDLSRMPPGVYGLQAMLDVNRNGGYNRRPDDGDLFSPVMKVVLPLTQPLRIALKPRNPSTAWNDTSRTPSVTLARTQAAINSTRLVEVESPALTAFWGRPISVRAFVMTPPGYQDGKERYPTVFFFGGFSSKLDRVTFDWEDQRRWDDMVSGAEPKMIWVFLEHDLGGVSHAFADSVNNGPWGRALTTEFIPWIDRAYRTDGKASGRFLTGHSTGGWAALWQQVRYPDVYGGVWATAPDYVDFRRAFQTDLYSPNANVYRDASGAPKSLARSRGEPDVPVEMYARKEAIISEYGGQLASFEWAFSPRGADGRPMPLFDRATGAVDPRVAESWKTYDISRILAETWTSGGRETARKLHILVGTADSYFLNEAVELLDANLKRLGATPDIRFIKDATHGTVLIAGPDGHDVERQIARDIYAAARP